jgi:tyrosine-protein kinase Etk/Wzc
MSGNQKISLWNIIVLLVKSKKKLMFVFLISLIVSYAGVYFLTEKQYESTATIIPLNESSLSGLSSLLNNVSSVLPMGLGNINKESDMNLYLTILFSRSSIENLIDKYDLQKLYNIKSRENAVKFVSKIIFTKITIENAFTIKVRTKSPVLAATMANYLVEYLNSKILELNVSKSRDSRIFLEKRYQEITDNLRDAEDSLKYFQIKSGVFEAENQAKSSLEAYARMDADVATKQIEIQVLNKMYGANSPNVQGAEIALRELRYKVNKLKSTSDSGSVLMSLNSLPQNTLNYYRYYRNVRIYSEMLSYVMPMYEQAKFEEQKNIPILQVIDPAIPPEKKAYPSRTFMSLMVTFTTLVFAASFLIVKDIFEKTENEKLLFLKKELFNFK